jgi:hypothetical protein
VNEGGLYSGGEASRLKLVREREEKKKREEREY